MNELFETRLQNLAQEFSYPTTPRIAEKVMSQLRARPAPRFALRRLTRSFAVAILLLAALMAVPPVRAAVLEFIRIGVVRIFPAPAPTIEAPRTALSVPAASDLIPILSQIAGETSLSEAQKMVAYQILLPAYPSDLGEPDIVFVQDLGGAMTVLIWLDTQDLTRVSMSLHFLPKGSWAIEKGFPKVIWETTVNGQRAFWCEGPYPLKLHNGEIEFTRLIEGHVLIWEADDVTYRLETDLPFLEAVRIAESLPATP